MTAMLNRLAPKIGIDLGTTNVLVFTPKGGVVANEPSVVALSAQGAVLAVGLEAKQMIGRTPESIQAHRPLKDGVIADYHVTEIMLRYFLKKALHRFNVLRPEVMVSVPAGISSTERRAVVEAVMNSGAKNAYIVKEPILAAIGAGVPIYEAPGHMVVDLGGGTTDAAVIALGGIVNSVSVKCAGNRFDAAIIDYVRKSRNLVLGEKRAEEVKIAIGSALPLEEELAVEVRGRDLHSGMPRTVELRTNEIVQALSRELKEVVQAVKNVFQETPPEIAADIFEDGILLTGGTAKLRNLDELITRRTGVPARVAPEPHLCVARGTGEALGHLETYRRAVAAKR